MRPKKKVLVREPAYGRDGHLWVDSDPEHDQLICATCGEPLALHSTTVPVIFKAGDLVRKPFEPPGYEGTVYTVAGVLPGNRGWVQLREYANPVGHEGLRLATDASCPSTQFPKALPDPGLSRRVGDVEHALPDGGFVRHQDNKEGRLFCPVCKPDTSAETQQTRPAKQTRRKTRERAETHRASSGRDADVLSQQSLPF